MTTELNTRQAQATSAQKNISLFENRLKEIYDCEAKITSINSFEEGQSHSLKVILGTSEKEFWSKDVNNFDFQNETVAVEILYNVRKKIITDDSDADGKYHQELLKEFKAEAEEILVTWIYFDDVTKFLPLNNE